MHRRVRFVVPASRRVERYYQCNSDRAPARSGTPPPQPTEVLVAVARKPGKPLLLGDPLIDCRDAARQRIFTGCILADSRFSCLANSSEERSHNDGHSILPGRRQTLRRKCDRRPDWAHSAATLASHAEEAGSQRPGDVCSQAAAALPVGTAASPWLSATADAGMVTTGPAWGWFSLPPQRPPRAAPQCPSPSWPHLVPAAALRRHPAHPGCAAPVPTASRPASHGSPSAPRA